MIAHSTDGVPVVWEALGSGEPAVVLVHGWATDRHLWDGVRTHLSARRRGVTLDLGGHGESGKGRVEWTVASLAHDVQAVVKASGARQVVLVGHSMGGPVVLEASRLLGPTVAGIVLVDTVLDAEERMPAEMIASLGKQLLADYAATTRSMSDEHLFTAATPPAVRERVLRYLLAADPAMSVALLGGVWSYDAVPVLHALRSTPIRAVSADKFPTKVDVNRRHIPGYSVEIVPGTSHYLMLEKPQDFNAALDRALAALSPS